MAGAGLRPGAAAFRALLTRARARVSSPPLGGAGPCQGLACERRTDESSLSAPHPMAGRDGGCSGVGSGGSAAELCASSGEAEWDSSTTAAV